MTAICKICQLECANVTYLQRHLKSHKDITPEEYYLTYINTCEPVCDICREPTLLINFTKGFDKVCTSKSCRSEYFKKIRKETTGYENPAQDPSVKERIKQTCLEKYGTTHALKSEKTKQKIKSTNMERYGVESAMQLQSIKDKVKTTIIERYGVDNISKLESCKEQKRQTSKERFGTETPQRLDSVKQKSIKTTLQKYGKAYYTQTAEYKEASKSTCISKYGSEHYLSSKEGIAKKQEFLNKHGVINAGQIPEIKDKIKATSLERYGVASVLSSSAIKEKIEHTNINKYGAANVFASKEIQDRIKDIIHNKYGVDHISQHHETYKKMMQNRKTKNTGYISSVEKKFAEFLTNRGFSFKYDYDVNGKHFDFAVFKDNDLEVLVEIDGEYNHGLVSDYDGKLVRGDNDHTRFIKVPDGVKYLVCDSSNIEQCIAELVNIFGMGYDVWIDTIIKSLSKSFPYPSYTKKRMDNDYLHLSKYTYIKGQYLGMSIIRHYHPSIWRSRVANNPTPEEAWNDVALLTKCVKNRFIYSSSLSSQSIADGFNVCKIAPKVSVFNPSIARRLVDTYLKQYNTVFDPFSGFSGRMLGVCSLDKHYIGSDINETSVSESNRIINDFGLNASVTISDVISSSGDYECLFTCPPYSLKETWGSPIVDKTCDEWIDICLKNFKCKTYMFVVDETTKYSQYVVEELKNQSHLSNNTEKVILIS